MIRVAHFSDLHYGTRTLVEADRCFAAAIERAIALGVEAAVISGVATDHPLDLHAPAAVRLIAQFRRLADHCPVLMLQGTSSVLNNFAVTTATRGKVTSKDIDVTFKGAFGVQFSDALTAVNKLREGDKSSMRELTNRSASALGLKPHQAQQFIKGMYKKALTQWGYDVETVSW